MLPADLRSALGFEEGTTVVAYLEGEGRLVIESPEAIQRALLAERRAAAAREAEEVEAYLVRVRDRRQPPD